MPSQGEADACRRQRYLRELMLAMSVHIALILLYGYLVPRTDSAFWRAVLVILPLLPVLLAIRTIIRLIRDQDEFERTIDLEAVAEAAMLTWSGYFSVGLLLSADVAWRRALVALAIWLLPCPFGSFGAARCLMARSYRTHG